MSNEIDEYYKRAIRRWDSPQEKDAYARYSDEAYAYFYEALTEDIECEVIEPLQLPESKNDKK